MTSVLIYCDDAGHARSVPVTYFDRIPAPSGAVRWQERYTGTAAQGKRESGLTLVDNEPMSVAEMMERTTDDLESRDVREKYVPTCRKCRRRPVKVQEGKLLAALNLYASAGQSRVSLSVLRATLSELAKRHG